MNSNTAWLIFTVVVLVVWALVAYIADRCSKADREILRIRQRTDRELEEARQHVRDVAFGDVDYWRGGDAHSDRG